MGQFLSILIQILTLCHFKKKRIYFRNETKNKIFKYDQKLNFFYGSIKKVIFVMIRLFMKNKNVHIIQNVDAKFKIFLND